MFSRERRYNDRVLMKKGFSLVEVLAVIAVIGLVTFLAIPNIVRFREDGEHSIAISKAEELNTAVMTYYFKVGNSTAWTESNDAGRFIQLVRADCLAFIPTNSTNVTLGSYMPGDFDVVFPSTLPPQGKIILQGPGGEQIPY